MKGHTEGLIQYGEVHASGGMSASDALVESSAMRLECSGRQSSWTKQLWTACQLEASVHPSTTRRSRSPQTTEGFGTLMPELTTGEFNAKITSPSMVQTSTMDLKDLSIDNMDSGLPSLDPNMVISELDKIECTDELINLLRNSMNVQGKQRKFLYFSKKEIES